MGVRKKLARCCSRYDNVDMLSFSVPRVAVVRDARLGIFNIVLQAIILTYVIIFNLIIQKGYRAEAEILHASRFRLFEPPVAGALAVGQLPYCTAPASEALPNGRPQSDSFPEVEECIFEDAFGVRHPPIEDGALFVTTRMTIRNETLPPECFPAGKALGCETTTSNGGLIEESGEKDYFVANVERYLVEIEHAMAGEGTKIWGTSRTIDGALQTYEGDDVEPCRPFTDYGLECPSEVGVGRPDKPDIVPLGALLNAASVPSSGTVYPLDVSSGLREPSVAEGQEGALQTLRRSGVVLDMKITYDNYNSWNQNKVSCAYQLVEFPGEAFDVEEVEELIPLPNGGATRLIVHRFGVRLLSQAAGRIGYFSLPTLIINLVAGFGLLALSTMAVGWVTTNCLYEGVLYERYWTTYTPTAGSLLEAGLTKKGAADALDNVDPVNPSDDDVVARLKASGGGRGGESGIELGSASNMRVRALQLGTPPSGPPPGMAATATTNPLQGQTADD